MPILAKQRLQLLLCSIKCGLPFVISKKNLAITVAHRSPDLLKDLSEIFDVEKQSFFVLTSCEKIKFYTGKSLQNAAKHKIKDKNQLAEISKEMNVANLDWQESLDIHHFIIRAAKKAETEPDFIISENNFESDAAIKEFADKKGISYFDYKELEKELTREFIKHTSSAELFLKPNIKAKLVCYQSLVNQHYAIIFGDLKKSNCPLVRMHSSCYTGDLLGSLSCDCQDQLHDAIKIMGQNQNSGIILYLMQEGRGIGLANKIKTYRLQAEGLDTVNANLALGFSEDERDFTVAKLILDDLNIKQIKLLTNNPKKVLQISKMGVTVKERVGMQVSKNKHNQRYLETKSERMGHIL